MDHQRDQRMNPPFWYHAGLGECYGGQYQFAGRLEGHL